MKKIYTLYKFIRYNNKKSRKEARKRRKKNRKKSYKKRASIQADYFSSLKIYRDNGYKIVKSPENLCLIDNTIEVLKFVNEIDNCLSIGKKVFIDLSSVNNLDHPAITTLVSIMTEFRNKNIDFNGFLPFDNKQKRRLKLSGFLTQINKPKDTNIEYEIGRPEQIFTRGDKLIRVDLLKELIVDIENNIGIPNYNLKGCYRVLVEAMHNTNNHASPEGQGKEYWWMSLEIDKKQRRVLFTFVDYGIGIIQSVRKPNHLLSKIIKNFTSDAKFLKNLLEKEKHITSTGDKFRGKGLPAIKKAHDRGQIQNLYIITNKVFADVTNNEYKLLNLNFSGTLLHWEINTNDYEKTPRKDNNKH